MFFHISFVVSLSLFVCLPVSRRPPRRAVRPVRPSAPPGPHSLLAPRRALHHPGEWIHRALACAVVRHGAGDVRARAVARLLTRSPRFAAFWAAQRPPHTSTRRLDTLNLHPASVRTASDE